MHHRIAAWLTSALLLASCATQRVPERLAALLPADVILLGEQHDAHEHQRIQQQVVESLAARGLLAAVALEMAERGSSTAGLARDATPDQVQAALRWNDAAWPWAAYGPAVMATVRAGVPVLGANLPRNQTSDAINNSALDAHLSASWLEQQRNSIREGHCGLLPESQIVPMTRIQIARDVAMAETIVAARQPGKTVLLIAGAVHVLRERGVPTHLPPDLQSKVILAQAQWVPTATNSGADAVWATPPLPPKDYCAALRQQWPAQR